MSECVIHPLTGETFSLFFPQIHAQFNVQRSEARLACWCPYGVSYEGLAAGLVLFLLAADVVEAEQQVVSLSQLSGQGELHLLIEVWRPGTQQQGQDSAVVRVLDSQSKSLWV